MSAQGALRHGNGAGFGLIETMRWQPGASFTRLDRHITRLSGSAAALGFACDLNTVEQALATVGGDGPLRVRLQLAADGTPAVTAQPFVAMPDGAVWAVRLATTRLSSADPLVRHKTTRRHIYEQARAEFPAAEADEVILLNELGAVCEGTITNVFVDAGDGGPLLTPPLEAGLLPGVLRAELLDEGKAREAPLSPADLASARRLFVGNSLRGLIAARLTKTLSTASDSR